jgi:heptosyltransferase-2
LERLAIFDADPVPRLTLNAQRSTLNEIALHPGSGSERKNWPEERWAELIDRLLRSTNMSLLLVGGEAEVGRLQRLAAALPPTRCKVAQSLPLAELGRMLERCVAFVGHDSGISHLAAALGLPCVVLWAHTDEEVWRPQGERLIIVKEAGVRTITVERILAEIGALVVRQKRT